MRKTPFPLAFAAMIYMGVAGFAQNNGTANPAGEADPGPAAVVFQPADWNSLAKSGSLTADGGTPVWAPSGDFRIELYAYNPLVKNLEPGWYQLRIQVMTAQPAVSTNRMNMRFWAPANTPDNWQYNTSFGFAEFPAPGTMGTLERTIRIGSTKGNFGLGFTGNWPGLEIASLKMFKIDSPLHLISVRANKLVYKLGESGTAGVQVLNDSGQPFSANLALSVDGGLHDTAKLVNQPVQIPAGNGEATPAELHFPLPAQPEYGHKLTAVLSQGGRMVGSAADYFYTSDHVEQIGQLGNMDPATVYSSEDAAESVAHFRHMLFPLYEIDFWAPDDALLQTSPPGQDRWWSGQTLQRNSTQSIKDRVDLGHAQGMKVLSYANLRYDYSFLAPDFFRLHPEWCDWDANDSDTNFAVNDIARQQREDDSERFDPNDPKAKPKFDASGIYGLMSGNMGLLDYHISQLQAAVKEFGFDGFRYDDRYDYGYQTTDMLGRETPYPGMSTDAIVARIRTGLMAVSPDLIYGHNMEWTNDFANDNVPMALGTPPAANDHYTAFVRDGGLHLQERYTAYMVGAHNPWTEIATDLDTMGYNAAARGGYAYAISGISNAREADAKELAAMYLAGEAHFAYSVPDSVIGYMRLACRHADLLYGDHLVTLTHPESVLTVNSPAPILWQPYVRYRELSPGHRVYLVHLINPPVGDKIGLGSADEPNPVANIGLNWHLPAGWKAVSAWHFTGDGGSDVDSVVTAGTVWDTSTTDTTGQSLVEEKLPFTDDGNGGIAMQLPKLEIWSVIAVEATGPTTDVTPALPFTLPPVPEQPELQEPALNPAPGSADGMKPINVDALVLGKATRVLDANGNQVPMPEVSNPKTDSGFALAWNPAGHMEDYGHGVAGGTYRLSLRLRATTDAPAGSTLHLGFWPNGRKWQVAGDIPLDGLYAGGDWQTITRDVQFGNDNGNFGISMAGGFNGLLIDYVRIEETQRWPDSKLGAEQGLKGWPATEALAPHTGSRVWHGEGLYYQYFGVEPALKRLDAQEDEAAFWTYTDKRGFNGGIWNTPDQLAGYDLIVLTDIDLKTLSLEQRDWLNGYVNAGGSVLFAGGPYGFGRGFWQDSDLVNPIFPVTLHPYDLHPSARPEALRAAPDGFLGNVDLGGMTALWRHEATPRPGAQVQLSAAGAPVLVTQTVGKGRVAALLLAPQGEGDATSWWQSAKWAPVMDATLGWLLHKEP